MTIKNIIKATLALAALSFTACGSDDPPTYAGCPEGTCVVEGETDPATGGRTSTGGNTSVSTGGHSTATGGNCTGGSTGNDCVGEEGCDCYGNNTCDAGLTCASGVCVELSTGTGGSTGVGGNTGTTCTVGDETCACYPNSTCNDDLTCASGICVDVGGTGTGGNSGTGGSSSTGGSTATGGTQNATCVGTPTPGGWMPGVDQVFGVDWGGNNTLSTLKSMANRLMVCAEDEDCMEAAKKCDNGYNTEFQLVAYAAEGEMDYEQVWQTEVGLDQPDVFCFFRTGGTCGSGKLVVESEEMISYIYVSAPESGDSESGLFTGNIGINFSSSDYCAPVVVCVEATDWVAFSRQ